MEEVKTIIGENIKHYMEINHFTQVDLAGELGVSPSAIRSWIKYGIAPRTRQINSMCELFGCSYSDIVSERSKEEIKEDILLQRITDFASRLTDEGKEKVLSYMQDLSGRFLK